MEETPPLKLTRLNGADDLRRLVRERRRASRTPEVVPDAAPEPLHLHHAFASMAAACWGAIHPFVRLFHLIVRHRM